MWYSLNGVLISGEERRMALKTLEKGLGLLKKDGWCQGIYRDEKTHRMCAWGSVKQTVRTGLNPPSSGVTAQLLKAGALKVTPGSRVLKEDRMTSIDNIIAWNDVRGRTAAQVTRAFQHAITIGKGLKGTRG